MVNVLSDNISVISIATNTVVATVPVGSFPSGVAITPNGAFAYVSTGINFGSVSVIDTATNTVVATVPVGLTPRGIAIEPKGAFAYVANRTSNDVSVIDTTTNMVVATIPSTFGPEAIAFQVPTQGPTNKDQCKNGGWGTFTNPIFKNQGDCVSFVNRMNHMSQ